MVYGPKANFGIKHKFRKEPIRLSNPATAFNSKFQTL